MAPGHSIPPAAKGRLLREMQRIETDPPPGVAAYTLDGDLTHIRSQITGPEGSPFEGGIFLLTVNITGRYPFEPPRCRFITPIYHPNIDAGGRICLDTLKSPPAGSWSPAVSLPSLLLSIRSLMAEPNPDDGLVPEISELYKRNPGGWSEEARRRTKIDATAEKAAEVESSLDGTSSSDCDGGKKSDNCEQKTNDSVKKNAELPKDTAENNATTASDDGCRNSEGTRPLKRKKLGTSRKRN